MSDVWDKATTDYMNAVGVPPMLGSPERMAKSARLGQGSGIPPAVIDLDPEGWQKRLQEQKNADLLKQSPALQTYVLKNPDNAKVSADDFEKLHNVAETVEGVGLRHNPMVSDHPMIVPDEEGDPEGGVLDKIIRPGTGVKIIEAVGATFGSEPLGLETEGPNEKWLREVGLFGPSFGQQSIEALVRPVAGAWDLVGRAISAGGAGLGEAAESLLQSVNELSDKKTNAELLPGAFGTPQQANRELRNGINWLLIELGMVKGMVPGVEKPPLPLRQDIYEFIQRSKELQPKTPREQAVEAMNRQAEALGGRKALEGPGIAERRASIGVAAVDAVRKAVEETATRTRSPAAMHDFVAQQVGEQTIRVPVTAVDELYASKDTIPAAGDKILGFVPDLQEQLPVARATGSDIEIPLAGYVTHVDPAIHDALVPNLRVTGATITEAKEIDKEAAKIADQQATAVTVVEKPTEGPLKNLSEQLFTRAIEIAKDGVQSKAVITDRLAQELGLETDQADKLADYTLDKIADEPVQPVQETGIAPSPGEAAIQAIVEERQFKLGVTDVPAVMYHGEVFSGDVNHLGILVKIGEKHKIPLEGLDEDKLVFGELVDGKFKSYGDTTANTDPGMQKQAVETVNKVNAEKSTETAKPVDEAIPLSNIITGYHGAMGKLKGGVLDPSKTRLQRGVFFSNKPELANKFALNNATDSDPAVFPDENQFLDWLETKVDKKTFKRATELRNDLDAIAVEAEKGGTELGADYTVVYNKLDEIARAVSAMDDGAPTVTRAQVDVGNSFEVDMGGRFDWDKEKQAIATAKEKGFHSVTIRNFGDKDPTSRIYTVFDKSRILAPEEVARRALFLQPLFKDAKSANMTEAEFKDYGKGLHEFRQNVAERKAEIMKAAAKRATRKLTEEEKVKATVIFDARKDIIAERMLRDSGVKLNSDSVDPKTIPRGLTEKNGAEPSDVADVLGYNSGAELLADLEGLHADRGELGPAAYKEDFINRSVRSQVPETPDFTAEMFSEPFSKVLYDDFRVMQRQNEGEGSAPLSLDELKVWAAENFSRMPVSRASKVNDFTRDVAANGRQAELALLKGKLPEAFKFKNQQLRSHLLAREAIKFQREFAKPLTPMLRPKKPVDPFVKAVSEAILPTEPRPPVPMSPSKLLERYIGKPPKNVPVDYAAQATRILMQHGVPIKRDLAELHQALGGTSLESFVTKKNNEGANIQVADFLFDPSFAKKLPDMTVEDHRALFDSLRSIDFNGRLETKAVRAGQEMAKEELVNQIVENVSRLPVRQKPGQRDVNKGVRHKVYQFDSILTRPEEVIDDLDLRDPQGPLNESVFRPLADSKHIEDDLHQQVAARLRELPDIEKGKALIPDVPFLNKLTATDVVPGGYPFVLNKLDVAMIAAQLGNKSSTEAIVGTLVGHDFYEAQPGTAIDFVRDFVEKHMTPKDWDFVEGLWDLFRDLKPLVDELGYRTSGVAPDDVGVLPWNGHGGGYFPIIHDPATSGVPALREQSPFDANYYKATTPKRYTKSRTGVFKPVLVVNLYEVLPGKLREIIHDIAFRESVTNAHKVLSDPKVQNVINKHYGKEYTDQFHPWLQNIANHFNQDDQMLRGLSSLLAGARKNIVVATLGFNAKVLLTPNVGPLIKYLGTSPLKASKMILNSGRYWQNAIENSGEIRHRLENTDRDIREVLSSQLGTQSTRQWIQSNAARAGMYAAVRIDTWLAMIAWNEEYAKAYHTGKSYFNATGQPFNHEEAVFAADKLVRKFFGSHSPVDLPAIMRSNEASKTFLTIFYGFQSTMYQRTRDIIQLSRDGARRRKEGDYEGARTDFAHALSTTWMFVILTALFGYVYTPQVSTKKDTWGSLTAKLLLGQLLSTVPLARDIAAAVTTDIPSRPSPTTQIILQAFKGGKDIISQAGNKPAKEPIRSGAAAAGYLLGLPLVQPGRSAQFLWNLSTGHDDARHFKDWYNGIVYGASKPK